MNLGGNLDCLFLSFVFSYFILFENAQAASYTKTLKNTFSAFGLSQEITTRVDFLDASKMSSFQFDLDYNLKNFLKEYYTNNLADLSNNSAYKNYIKNNFKKRTIVIGVDGLDQSCAKIESYKSFAYLMANGSYKIKTRSTTEGLSGPGWSSILYSLNSKDTGIVDNKWNAPWINQKNLNSYYYATPITGLNTPLPSVFDLIKQRKGGNFINMFYSSWDFFNSNFNNEAVPNSIDYWTQCLISVEIFNQYYGCDSFSLIAAKNFLLMDGDLFFWYFSSLDVAGHDWYWCGPEYSGVLNDIDSMLLEFFNFLKLLQIEDKVNIILTSDHGSDRNKFSHGNDKYDGNLMVPLFMMGPDFKKNYPISIPVSTIDIAPTIALINNVLPSEYWAGTAIVDALNFYNEKFLVNSLIVQNTSNIENNSNYKYNATCNNSLSLFLVFFITLILF